MGFQAKAGFVGLVTASAETGAEQGALRIADNVTLRRSGALEARPGFIPLSVGYAQPALTFLAAHHFGALTLYETSDRFRNSAGAALDYTAVAYSGMTISPARLRADIRDSAVQRGNLYVPFSTDVLKLESAAAAEWRSAGLAVQYIAVRYASLNAGLGSMLLANYHVGYRLVLMRTDANGVITRSRPTGTIDVVNTFGTNAAVVLGIRLSNGSNVDYLELYRTRSFPAAVALDDEMQLVARVTGAVAMGGSWYGFVDNLADTARTTTLYTSPSRGGIEGANDRPPAAACIETFRNCMFFGNTVGPQRIVASHKYAQSGLDTSVTGVGYRSMAATITSGSATLTVPGAAYLQRGMLVKRPLDGDAYRWITNISGTTVTLNGTMSGSGTTGEFYDALEINGQWIEVGTSNRLALGMTVHGSTYIGSYELTPPVAGYQSTNVIETVARNQAPFSIRATHGDEYMPPLPKYGETATTDSTSKADVLPNGLSWSQPDEPEHVPAKNAALVGDKKSAIIALVALRDALLILKEDGIFRLTGTFPAFRVDVLDPTTFCLLPSSVRKLDARVYFLSNKGLVAVDETGTTIVSDPVRNTVARLVDDVRTNFAATGLYRLQGFAGETAAVDDRNREYLLSTGVVTLDTGGDLLVYSAPRAGFTTFSFSKDVDAMGFTPTGYGTSANGSLLILQLGGARVASYARITMGGESVPLVADGETALTVSAVVAETSESARLTYSPSATLRVGDVVVRGSGVWRVLSQPSTTSVVVSARSQVYPTTGAATVYRPITLTAQPQGFVESLQVGKLWTHAAWAYSRLVGPTYVSAGFASATPSVSEAAQTTTEEVPLPPESGYARLGAGTLLRHPVPTVHRRGYLLRVSTRLTLAFGEVLLEAVMAEARDNAPNHMPTHATGIT